MAQNNSDELQFYVNADLQPIPEACFDGHAEPFSFELSLFQTTFFLADDTRSCVRRCVLLAQLGLSLAFSKGLLFIRQVTRKVH
jgi:hypothetical protein